MTTEMAQQPAVIADLLQRRDGIIRSVRDRLPQPLRGIALLARGSSDHAAVFGRYVLELASGRPVTLAAPSLHTVYGAHTDYEGYLAIAISQSGRTPEIVNVLAEMCADGAVGIGITNGGDTPLAHTAALIIELRAGDERAVPATKTFTGQLAAFAFLAEALGRVPWSEADWERVPDSIRSVLADGASAERVAEDIGAHSGLIIVGRGFLFSVALEAALKLKETSGILAQGYSSADLRHGPIAVIEQEFPVVSLHAPGPAGKDVDELVDLVRQRGGRVFRLAASADAELPIPELPEALTVFPAAVRAQQLAHALAVRRGLDPDRPAGLQKVTPTR